MKRGGTVCILWYLLWYTWWSMVFVTKYMGFYGICYIIHCTLWWLQHRVLEMDEKRANEIHHYRQLQKQKRLRQRRYYPSVNKPSLKTYHILRKIFRENLITLITLSRTSFHIWLSSDEALRSPDIHTYRKPVASLLSSSHNPSNCITVASYNLGIPDKASSKNIQGMIDIIGWFLGIIFGCAAVMLTWCRICTAHG